MDRFGVGHSCDEVIFYGSGEFPGYVDPGHCSHYGSDPKRDSAENRYKRNDTESGSDRRGLHGSERYYRECGIQHGPVRRQDAIGGPGHGTDDLRSAFPGDRE